MSKSAPRKDKVKPKPEEKPPPTTRRRLLTVFVPVIIMILIVAILAGIVLSSDAANRAAAATQVSTRFESHLLDIRYQNVTLTLGQYENNATVTFTGDDENFGGENQGGAGITALYQYLYSDNAFGTINFSDTSFSVNALNGQHVNVDSTFTLQGVSEMYSDFKGLAPTNGTYLTTVSLHASYSRFGTNWEISNETWDFADTTLSP